MSYELFSYWRSTASWRVRLVLELKQLPYIIVPVHLLRDGGEQNQAAYRRLNPQGLVPALRDGNWVLSQSNAICEYLETEHPQTPLLPADAKLAAEIRALCALISCDTHPLNNLSVLQFLKNDLNQDEAACSHWYQHWIARCFSALEETLQSQSGQYCFGDQPSLADCYLIPQIYNARRFDCPLQDYAKLLAVEELCSSQAAFIRAHPDQQPDCPDQA